MSTPPIVVAGTQVGPKSQPMTCPSCRNQIMTKIKGSTTARTHIVALLLCIFGCWPCVLIPYCTTCCSNVDHYCPLCETYIGTYIR